VLTSCLAKQRVPATSRVCGAARPPFLTRCTTRRCSQTARLVPACRAAASHAASAHGVPSRRAATMHSVWPARAARQTRPPAAATVQVRRTPTSIAAKQHTSVEWHGPAFGASSLSCAACACSTFVALTVLSCSGFAAHIRGAHARARSFEYSHDWRNTSASCNSVQNAMSRTVSGAWCASSAWRDSFQREDTSRRARGARTAQHTPGTAALAAEASPWRTTLLQRSTSHARMACAAIWCGDVQLQARMIELRRHQRCLLHRQNPCERASFELTASKSAQLSSSRGHRWTNTHALARAHLQSAHLATVWPLPACTARHVGQVPSLPAAWPPSARNVAAQARVMQAPQPAQASICGRVRCQRKRSCWGMPLLAASPSHPL
jgi:hypothetical protein